ncbi:MAG: PKD domain-containing protein, partial [Bacteroidota bacterium]
CFGGSNGTASAIASGGTSAYTYQWQPGGIAGTTILNLIASTYTVEVTDSKSCIKTLPVVITEPSQLTSVISSSSNVTCMGENNGNATVTASGGSLTYNYNWLPSGGNGPTGTGLVSGTYTVTVTDFKSCNTTSSVTITEPSQALSAISTGSSTSCYGGSNGTASINTIGGTPSYSYQWTPAVSITDTAFGLSPGNYTILVTDSNNCQINKSVNIAEPPAINGNLAYVNPSCGLSNGSVSSQLSGGAFPYTYLWSWGASTTTGINNLPPGTYNVQITDSLNCIFPLSANLVNIPSPSVAVSSINNVGCYGGNNGSTTINITQGTAPYAINWTPSGGNSLTANSLSIGTYTVNVTDAIGCQTSDTVIITEPTPIDVSISSITNALCNGGNTGSISVSPTGGTGPLYTYSWAPNSASTSTAANLSSGSYTVSVMDQNNCTKSISATISQPTVLSSSANVIKNPACFDGTGSASVVAAGGVIPYSYSWSAPAIAQTGSTANDLIAGSYTVTVTDTNGCISTSSVVLTQPQKLITTAGENDTICLGQSGTVTAIANGGTGSYYFVWQPSGINNAGSLDITPTSNTTYTVVAYDQIGCAGTPSTVSAIVYTLNGANVQAIATSPICPGQISAVYVETSGTTGPLTYQWNNNLGTGPGVYLATPTQPTTYIVTVSNVCGLSVTDSVDVLFNPQPTVVVSAGPTALCALGGVQFTDISITGNINDPITSWYWNFGDGTSSTEQNPFHYFDQSGTFFATLTVNTDGGCTSENGITPLTITSYPAPVAAFAVNSNDLLIPYDVLICDNQSVGANSYEWSFGEGGTSTAVNPEYVYTLSGTFQVQLIATSQHGCLDTAYMDVITNANVIFPNVFTPDPNGSSGGTYTLFDLSNDVFFPYTYGVVEYKLEMFNRWGEQIFESLDIKTGWDGYYRGEICQQDVYVWKAYIKLNNGKIYNLSGDLTLLRY